MPLLADAAAWLFGDSGRMVLGFTLLAVALYYRKALGAGRIVQTWAGRATFSAVVIGIALLLGIIPDINVAVLMGYVDQVVGVVRDLLGGVLEGITP